MKLLLLFLALLVGELCLAQETTTVPAKAKNETGPGRYRERNNYRRRDYDDYYRTPVVDDYICDLEATILVVSSKHHVKEEKSYGGGDYGNKGGYGGDNYGSQGGYGQQSYGGEKGGYGQQNNYGGGQSYGGQQNYGGNQGYGGQQSYGGNQGGYGGQSNNYGNQGGYGGQGGYEEKPKRRREYSTPDALRLKCSHIAVHSEHDCNTCCRLSARRDHSFSKHEIFGFIIDANEIKYDDKGLIRYKRSDNYSPAPPTPSYGGDTSYPAAPAPEYTTPGYGSSDSGYGGSPSYGGNNYYGSPKNGRCVCCAPKRHHHDHHRRRHHDRYDSSDSDEY